MVGRVRKRLEQAVADAGSAGAAAVVGGEVCFVIGDDEPVVTQSVTKLVVALGAGIALGSLGDPVILAQRPLGETFAEWGDDSRAEITIADLLGHTSGLEPVTPHQLEDAEDPVTVALRTGRDEARIGMFSYNNAGPILVDEAVRRLTTRPVSVWLDDELFGALGVSPSWSRWPDGTAQTHGGLISSSRDLATIAWAAHESAIAKGPVPSEWVTWMVDSGRSAYRQYAWAKLTISEELVRTWREGGVDSKLLDQLPSIGPEPVDQAEFLSQLSREVISELGAAIHGRGLQINESELGPPVGWGHDGDGSQWLIVADHPAGLAHTRSPDHYRTPPTYFPPQLLLDCLTDALDRSPSRSPSGLEGS